MSEETTCAVCTETVPLVARIHGTPTGCAHVSAGRACRDAFFSVHPLYETTAQERAANFEQMMAEVESW